MPAESSRLRLAARRDDVLQQLDARGAVPDALLLVARLALDDEGAAVTHLLQRRDEGAHAYLPLPQRRFLSPLARRRRPLRVLTVNAADVRSQDLHRSDGIAHVI